MSFTLSTYNVHMGGILPHGAGSYDLAAATATLTADVRVFQEIFDSPDEPTSLHVPGGHERIEMSYTDHYQRPHWPSALTPEQIARIGSWKLVVTSALPVLERREIAVPKFRGDSRDKVLALRLQAPEGGFWLVAVHLATGMLPLSGAVQLAALKRQLPEGPCVITGDHNLWRAIAQRILGREWTCPVRGGTWPAHRPIHHIDHVWLRGIHGSAQILPGLGSDHLPVSAELHLAGRCRSGRRH